MSKSKSLRIIAYHYYCDKCSKNYKYIVDFEQRLDDYACPQCHEKLKYKGGTDIAISSIGNCGYQSAEKISDQNKKRIGEEAYKKMCEADPVVKGRMDWKKEEKPWWRAGMDKPLKLSEIKDTEKYIMTGEKN